MKWLKRLSLVAIVAGLLLVTYRPSGGAGIVNNSGTSSEDSLAVAVLSVDSMGFPVSADSFFVMTIKSGTNEVIFRDSGTIAMTGLDSAVLAGKTYYYYHRAVADIDGAGAVGQYVGIVTAKKNSPLYLTPNVFEFQIANVEFSDMGDSVGLGARTSLAAIDSLGFIIDSLYAVIDSIRNHPKWVMVPSDTTWKGDSVAVCGTNKSIRFKSFTVRGYNDSAYAFEVSNTTGDAVHITGGYGGGEPINGDGVDIRSLSGKAVNAEGTTADFSGDYSGVLGNAAIVYGTLATGCFGAAQITGEAARKIADSFWKASVADTANAGTFWTTLLDLVALAADSSLWANAAELMAKMDSLARLSGSQSYSFAFNNQHLDVDTMFFGTCVDSLCTVRDTSKYAVYWHTGGPAGGSPDSSKTYDY